MPSLPFRLLVLSVVAAVFLAGSRGNTRVRAQDAVADSMVNNQFAPVTLTVATGTTVTWVNNEDPSGTNVTHDIESDDFTWGSGYVNPGESYSFTFTAPGTYHYVCDLHDGMEGTVIVQ